MIFDHARVVSTGVFIVGASTQDLSATAVGVTRSETPSRTVSVPNAQLQASAASSVVDTVPPVSISASSSQTLSATSVGVDRNPPTGAPTADLSASNIFGATASYNAQGTSHPSYPNDQLTFEYDPDANRPTPPATFTDGETATYDYSQVGSLYQTDEIVTVKVTVTDPDGNSDTATDTCSVGDV